MLLLLRVRHRRRQRRGHDAKVCVLCPGLEVVRSEHAAAGGDDRVGGAEGIGTSRGLQGLLERQNAATASAAAAQEEVLRRGLHLWESWIG